jgi:hypothetical protein
MRTWPGADALAAAREVERFPHSELWQMVVFLHMCQASPITEYQLAVFSRVSSMLQQKYDHI